MNGNSAAGTIDHQPDLLARLQNVVRQLNRPDIRNVSVLIARVLGDQNAGLMCVPVALVSTRQKSRWMGLQIVAGLER